MDRDRISLVVVDEVEPNGWLRTARSGAAVPGLGGKDLLTEVCQVAALFCRLMDGSACSATPGLENFGLGGFDGVMFDGHWKVALWCAVSRWGDAKPWWCWALNRPLEG